MNTKIDLLEYNDLVSLSNKELIEIDGGVDEITQSVLEWVGRQWGRVANAVDTASKGFAATRSPGVYYPNM
jgi:hypothetical protein